MILLDETGDVNVNKWIASNGYGQFDPETKHFLFDDTTSNYDSVEEPLDDEYQNRSFDVQFDECDIKKLVDNERNSEREEFPLLIISISRWKILIYHTTH